MAGKDHGDPSSATATEPCSVVSSRPIAETIKRLENNLKCIIDIQYSQLLFELKSAKILTTDQIECIKSMSTPSSKVISLLVDITESPEEQSIRFLDALEKTDQKHVSNYIRANGKRNDEQHLEWPLYYYAPYIDSISSNLVQLCNLLDVRYGLLIELVSSGCITKHHKDAIDEKCGTMEKNVMLIDILQRRSVMDYDKFVKCLFTTKQHGVASILVCLSDSPTIAPIEPTQRQQLMAKLAILTELIDPTELVVEMYAADCITWQHKDAIESANTKFKSNDLLLDIVQRGSQEDFNTFIECLDKTGQKHVSRILLEDGAIPCIDAKTKWVAEKERQIVVNFGMLPDDRKQPLYDQLAQQLPNKDTEIVAMATTHSIRLYILCKTSVALKYLREIYENEKLKGNITCIFNSLLHTDSCESVDSMAWETSNYMECDAYLQSLNNLSVFSMVHQCAQENWKLHKTAPTWEQNAIPIDSNMPIIVSEMLLTKAVGQLFAAIINNMPQLHTVRDPLKRIQPHILAVATVCAVSRYWWKLLTRRSFIKQQLRQHWRSVYYPFERSSQLVKRLQIGGDNHVKGVVEFNNKLYVACAQSNRIQVFCSVEPFGRLDDIEVHDLSDAIDIAVSSETSQLYVIDWGKNVIWRVNLVHEKQVETFVTIQKWQPFSLSIRCGFLLITPYVGDSLYRYREADGQSNAIKLPSGMLAYHAVETSKETYVVGLRHRSENRLPDVSEVDAAGRVVRSFDTCHNNAGSIRLNFAYYMLLTRSHVLIADRHNERVVLAKSDLCFKRVLIASLRGQPHRMCLSKSGLLYIAYLHSTKVDVYIA